MRDIAVAAVFVVMAGISITRPWVGILLWTWVSLMNPHRLCYGFMSNVPVALIAGSIAIVSFLFFQNPKRMAWSTEVVVLIALMFWMTVTTVAALNPDDAWLYWGQVMKIDLMVLLTLMVMREPRKIDALVWVIVLSLGYFGFKGGLFTLLGGGDRVYGPPDSFIADNNDLAVALAMVVPLIRYLALHTERRWLRFGLNILTMLTVVGILGTYSRAGFLAMSVSGLALWLKSRHKVATAALIGVVVITASLKMPDAWFDRIRSIQSYEDDGSAQQRFDSWRVAWQLASDRPVTGGGFRALTPELVRKYSSFPFHETHSMYLKIMAEHGFFGLFLFVVLFGLGWRSAGGCARMVRGIPELAWMGDLMRAVQVGFVAYFVGGAFGAMCYFDLPYTMLAIVALCKQYARQAIDADDLVEASEEEGAEAGAAAHA